MIVGEIDLVQRHIAGKLIQRVDALATPGIKIPRHDHWPPMQGDLLTNRAKLLAVNIHSQAKVHRVDIHDHQQLTI
ncbi:hypothetical protein D3C76_1484310 [compost metagenome]